ncbi:MAG: sulfate adenylyltransferase [Nitrososphaerales archaeon]|nr:sulfate adenylyltransferase [Nitrososphaerales archaeon]
MPRPHGGKLIDRDYTHKLGRVSEKDLSEMPRKVMKNESLYDVVNIAQGVYSPLEGFMNQEDYLNVLYQKRLVNDLPWTIPIVLSASKDEVSDLKGEDEIVLVDEQGKTIAIMHMDASYRFDKKEMAERVFGTLDKEHVGVARVFDMDDFLIGGKVDLVRLPDWSYSNYHLTPLETRTLFRDKGWRTIVGFQTRNIPHLGHEYLQKTALTFVDGIFINPVIGRKKKGDFEDGLILKSYDVLIKNYYVKERVVLAILRTEMRYAGPREAIFHAIIRKNFGCTHFIVGRDHAGLGKYYPPYSAQEIFSEFPDLGITPLFFTSFFYCNRCNGIMNEKTCPHDKRYRIEFSGTKLRDMISRKQTLPRELIRPEVADVVIRWSKPFVEVSE